jgi:tetratricopeptide (TPR) repeat protein
VFSPEKFLLMPKMAKEQALMGRKRITKKQLKEDAFVSATFEASHYIQENRTRIILGIVGFLALIGVVWLYINYRQDRLEESSTAMFRAQSLYMNGQYALAAADFEKLAEEYSGSALARKAFFFAGDAYYEAGDYQQALSRFEECREKLSEDDPLLLNCLVGQAAACEQLENLDKAIEVYREALATAGYDYQKLEILISLCRVLAAAGRNTEALELTDRIIEDYPDYPRSQMIVELRAELKARLSAQKGS